MIHFSPELDPCAALEDLCRALAESVRREAPDLSARQMAVLVTVYTTAGPHTIRGLARHLRISKSAVTRALDRLNHLEFIRRKTDEDDRRNVLIQRTVRGSVFLREYSEIFSAATAATGHQNTP